MKIQEDTREVGMGALSFNVTLAKVHGWTHGDIEAAWNRLEGIMFAYGKRAERRHPELYGPYGEFLGDIPEDTHES